MIYLSAALLFLSSVIWGLAYIPTRFLGQSQFGVFFELVWRFSIPTLLLFIFFFKEIRSLDRSARMRSVWAGLVLFAGLFLAVQGLRIIASPTVGFFLLSLNPIFIPLYLALRSRRMPSSLIIVGSLAAAGGSALMAWGDPRIPPDLGTLLCILSTVAFSSYIILCSRITQDIPPRGLLFYHCLTFVVLSVPLFLLFEAQILPQTQVWQDPRLWLAVLYQGLGSGTLAYLLYFSGIRRTPPAAAAIILGSQSVVGAVAEYFLFGVRIAPLTMAGGGLILGATLAVSILPEKSKV